MILKLVRFLESDTTTLGRLFIDNYFFCYTLEDKVRDVKIKGETAIPEGVYTVVMTYSNRFKRSMPLIYNKNMIVKKDGMIFRGVRFHGGNTHYDTEGCILIAEHIDVKEFNIWGSKSSDLNKKLKNQKNIELIITNEF